MERVKILWFGEPPSKEDGQQAKDHGFQLAVLGPSDEPDFRFGRLATFWATGGYFEQAAVCLKKFGSMALDEGLYVVVVVSGGIGDVRLGEVNKILREIDPHTALEAQYRVRSAPVLVHHLMNQALGYDPGPLKNQDLNIDYPEGELTTTERLLLQRAFHDCRSIRLRPIPHGYSGAKTFIVEAKLKDSNAGPEPEPFFTKLGETDKLQKEMMQFQQFAEHHIPWYLRPNFVRERCIYGVTEAVLVGNFVRNSSSLGECAHNGNGAQLIRSLFEETLAGLRRQADTPEDGTSTSVVDALAEFCNHEGVPRPRWTEAAQVFGGEPVEPARLWWRLLSLPARSWRKSVVHGDMHGENVRVRKQDAIVIDFAQACVGPASADLASLEVWLSFEASNRGPVGEEWKAVIAELYSTETIDASLDNHAFIEGATWIHACVAEIRRLARDAVESKDEYKRVLAVYLLRQASFPANPGHPQEDEFRRTYAYWLSCQLVASLQTAAEVTRETA